MKKIHDPDKRVCVVCGKTFTRPEGERMYRFTARNTCPQVDGKYSPCAKELAKKSQAETMTRKKAAKLSGQKGGITRASKRALSKLAEYNKQQYKSIRTELIEPYKPKPGPVLISDEDQAKIDRVARSNEAARLSRPLSFGAIHQTDWLFCAN